MCMGNTHILSLSFFWSFFVAHMSPHTSLLKLFSLSNLFVTLQPLRDLMYSCLWFQVAHQLQVVSSCRDAVSPAITFDRDMHIS